MKIVRQIGSLAFVAGLFVTVFAGVPWHVLVEDDPAERYVRFSVSSRAIRYLLSGLAKTYPP